MPYLVKEREIPPTTVAFNVYYDAQYCVYV